MVKDGEFMGRKLHPLIGDYGLVCCSSAYGCGEDERQPGEQFGGVRKAWVRGMDLQSQPSQHLSPKGHKIEEIHLIQDLSREPKVPPFLGITPFL